MDFTLRALLGENPLHVDQSRPDFLLFTGEAVHVVKPHSATCGVCTMGGHTI